MIIKNRPPKYERKQRQSLPTMCDEQKKNETSGLNTMFD